MFNNSLKLRLTFLILMPLLVVAILLIIWRFYEIRQSTQIIFDNNLKIITLAISRDISNSEGDALSPSTKELIEHSTGGQVFYHVRGPLGTFITGYGYPPIIKNKAPKLGQFYLTDAKYQRKAVRVAQIIEKKNIDGVAGNTATTVWQDINKHQRFAWELFLSSTQTIIILIIATLIIIFFSIGFGLKPLREIEDAIEKRSFDDISPIKRLVPNEVKGIVSKINFLFAQLSKEIKKQDRFISNAAHQLRNPIAALHANAENANKAKTEKDVRERVKKLSETSKYTTHLINQLLSLDGLTSHHELQKEDSNIVLSAKKTCERVAPAILNKNIQFEFDTNIDEFNYPHNALLFGESLENLIDNALKHGGDDLSKIAVNINYYGRGDGNGNGESNGESDGKSNGEGDGKDKQSLLITVSNDGKPINSEFEDHIFERFEHSELSKGHGLGLAIVWEIIHRHGATITLDNHDNAVSFSIKFSH